ncbi:IS481 family transposase [Candidatus Methylomirabilis sp.]|uniref:IS481 family transposase n=1 Tax=Candidatus Methylomirabilis sp. TaxID=2032687 RepID=UPI002A63B4C1|nr:IS481 family transposase [Candidatus Methylomirabilis sp.]
MPHLIREQRIRQRLNWFQKARELGSVTDACCFFGISRKTYYKWQHRYAASQGDRLSLADRSRRPHAHPRQVGIRMARRLRRWRRRTGYGPRRLRWHLQRTGLRGVPSVYGIHRVLQRAGLLTRHRTRPKHRQRYVMPQPGDCVQVDIKYVPYCVEGRQVYQYTALDDCTRLRVVRIFPELTNRAGLTFLTMLRSAFPFRVRQVQTDNDATFTNWYTGAPKTAPERAVRLHPFTLACAAAGIRHRTIRPRSPHLNGKVERSHRIDGEEFYRVWRCRTFADLQKRHRRFNQFYNTARPHGGHGGRTPLERLRQFAPFRGLRRLYL